MFSADAHASTTAAGGSAGAGAQVVKASLSFSTASGGTTFTAKATGYLVGASAHFTFSLSPFQMGAGGILGPIGGAFDISLSPASGH